MHIKVTVHDSSWTSPSARATRRSSGSRSSRPSGTRRSGRTGVRARARGDAPAPGLLHAADDHCWRGRARLARPRRAHQRGARGRRGHRRDAPADGRDGRRWRARALRVGGRRVLPPEAAERAPRVPRAARPNRARSARASASSASATRRRLLADSTVIVGKLESADDARAALELDWAATGAEQLEPSAEERARRSASCCSSTTRA